MPRIRSAFVSPDSSPPTLEKAEQIHEYLLKNHADLRLVITNMKKDTGYQGQLFRETRLTKGLELILSMTNINLEALLEELSDGIQEMDKFEREQKYYKNLKECLSLGGEFYGMGLKIQEYDKVNPKDEEDAWNRYKEKVNNNPAHKEKVGPLVRPEGLSFMIRIELDPNGEEFKKCGLWVSASGVGRDRDQAARDALRMLQFKKDNELLWVNEGLKKERVDFFNKKLLKETKRRLEKNHTELPTFCDSYKDESKPERPKLWRMLSSLSSRTSSVLSLKGLKEDDNGTKTEKHDQNYESHTLPRKERRQKKGDEEGSDTDASRRKEGSPKELTSNKDSDNDALHTKERKKKEKNSVREGSDKDEAKRDVIKDDSKKTIHIPRRKNRSKEDPENNPLHREVKRR